MGDESDRRPDEEIVPSNDYEVPVQDDESADQSETFIDDSDDDDEDEEDEPIVIPKLKQAASWLWERRRVTIPALLAVVLVGIMIVPKTRYGLAGIVLHRDFNVVVVDEQTGVAVSDADVTMRGKTVRTNADGVAHFDDLPIGITVVAIHKAYFEPATQPVTVGFRSADLPPAYALKATGRPVPINVVDKITGKGVPAITISAAKTSAITNERGETTLVLPPDDQTYQAVFTGDSYNTLEGSVQVSQQVVSANTFQMTPAGNAYYVGEDKAFYGSLLDGAGRRVIRESFTDSLQNLQVKQSADGRFIAFVVQKGQGQQALVFQTETEDFTEIETKADQFIDLIGWADNQVHYRLVRSKTAYWQASRTALKRYDAAEKKSFIIDQNSSQGGSENDAVYEEYGELHLLSGGLFFSKTWLKPAFAETEATQADGLYFSKPDSEDIETLHTVEKSTFGTRPVFETYKTAPNSVIVRYTDKSDTKNFRFEDGLLVSQAVENKAFRQIYPVYLPSPGGLNTLWLNQNKLLVVGDQNAQAGKVIEEQTGFSPYGWVTDNYILVLEGDDLYIMPSNGLGTLGSRVRIAEGVVLGR